MKETDPITWRPGFNDPDLLGGIAFAAYAIASFLCIRAALSRDSSPPDRQSKRAWLVFGLALAFLGLNEQMDLHALLIQCARRLAQTQGWYDNRRLFQYAFMVIFSVVLVTGMSLVARRFMPFVKSQRIAVTGALLILGYVLIRNAAFNHIDDREGSVWNMKDALRVVELTGVAAIGLAAWRFSSHRSQG